MSDDLLSRLSRIDPGFDTATKRHEHERQDAEWAERFLLARTARHLRLQGVRGDTPPEDLARLNRYLDRMFRDMAAQITGAK